MSAQNPQASGWVWSDFLGQRVHRGFENGRHVVILEDGSRMNAQELLALQSRQPRILTGVLTDRDRLAAQMQAHLNVREDTEEGVDRHGVRGRIIFGPGGERILRGTAGDHEVLDESYRKRRKPREFFTVGKVFHVLWVEPTSITAGTRVTSVALGGGAYTSIRRFIVCRPSWNHCIAVPILTYGGKGIHKPGIELGEHALVYLGNRVPPNTGGLAVIQIDPEQRDATLDPMSVTNLGKSYTIEHNLKVKPFGMVRDRRAFLEAVANARGAVVQQGEDDDPAEGSSTSNIQAAARQWEIAFQNNQVTREAYDAAIANMGQPTQSQSQTNQRAQAIAQAREEEEEEEEESEEEESPSSSEEESQHYTHQYDNPNDSKDDQQRPTARHF